MGDILRDIADRNRAGEAVAIPSVCSAHPDVLRATMARAAAIGRPIVVEATSNQVNQDGGYTGLTPHGFVDQVQALADAANLDRAQIVLGGDHLGPQAWRDLDADAAMAKAHDMMAAYAKAGFTKIHLDCSQACKGEKAALDDAITASRSAELAHTCLAAAPDPDRLLFVIGTEVPSPGGARMDETGTITATRPEDAEQTLAAHRTAFAAAGIGAEFDQVIGLVVQPGVEFSPMDVHRFPPDRALPYRQILIGWPGICLEAHSTDYQDAEVFQKLAAEGFAFQKVGPALTFAWRQAIYALDQMLEMLGRSAPPIWRTMEAVMMASPDHWRGHYSGSDQDVFIARHFGLADRIRYYWPQKEARMSIAALMDDIGRHNIPDPMFAQYFAPAVLDRASNLKGRLGDRLIDAQVQLAIDPYFFDASLAAREAA